MSLFDSASLIVTPSGYKEDKLYSIKPSDGSGDLVVTRATTATRVNSDGLIEQVPYNLLQRSEEFNNAAWVAGGAGAFTVTANDAIAPNGTLTADKLIAPLTNQTIRQNVANTNTAYNLSFYLKTNSGTKQMRLFINDTELTSVANVTSEWQLFTLSGTTGNTLLGSGRVGISNVDILDNSSFVYIWGAQLVQGTSAKEYFPTTDRLDVPRLDYTNSSCPSILVEPQRTNLLTYSEQFNDGSWTKSSATITENTSVAPTGNTTADTLVITSGGYLLKSVAGYSAVSGQSITISIFAKNQTTNFLTFGGATAAGTDVYSIQDYGSGWYRHIRTRTFTTTATTTLQYIIFNQIGTNIIWGAQIEAGSNATSYVPTVASSVTRNADVISKTGISSLIGQTEGTLFMDCKINSLPLDGSFFGIQKTSSNFVIRFGSNGSVIYAQSYNGSTNLFYQTFSYTLGSRIKAAFAYKAGSYAFYINGVQIGTGSNATAIPACDATMFNSLWGSFNGSLSFYSTAALWKTRLTNAEIASLTTI